MTISSQPYVVDASVLVGNINPTEIHYADCRLLLQKLATAGARLHTPAIALPEIAAAISRGSGDSGFALKVVASYREWLALHIAFVDESLAALSATVAAQYQIRGCDAVYVALAEVLGATLITLDRQQRERSQVALPALAPAQVLATLP